ncbi:MAG: hypothetical protein ACLR2O_10790 [Coprococcus sp.]
MAECLGITVRSARRIMNKIMEAGYWKSVCKEDSGSGWQTEGTGRDIV